MARTRRFMEIGSTRRAGFSSLPRWFVVALALLFVGQSILYVAKASGYTFKGVVSEERSNRSAILRWREQLLHLGDQDIYRDYNYPNPPIMALLLEPIAHLPPLLGSLCWFYLKLGMTLLALRCIFRLIETPEQPFPG